MSPLYFSAETIIKNFKSLSLRMEQKLGKTNLERTTAIGVFLSLDMTQKILGMQTVNLNPVHKTENGTTPRQIMTTKYVELFMPSSKNEDKDLIVRELGSTHVADRDGRKYLKLAFSSNFLTVPLKRASVASSPRSYPGRPFPLLTLGVGAEKWGAEKHPDWKSNFIKFIESRECGGDFFPIIVYLLRYQDLGRHFSADFPSCLRSALREILTDELSDYLVSNSSANKFNSSKPGVMTGEVPDVDFRSISDNTETEGVKTNFEVKQETEVEWPEPDDVVGSESFDLDVVRRALAALESGSHLILIGPPGTGKTTLANRLTERCKGNLYQIYTATSDWTTHEVLGGYMPDPKRPERLTFYPGIVTRALSANEWLIVDEINRADVDKAFGELFTFLADKDVILTHSYQVYDEAGEPVGSPKRIVLKAENSTYYDEEKYTVIGKSSDWRMIGTMNTFDKAALYQLSYAFMRRFAFVEVPAPLPQQSKEIITSAIDLAMAKNSFETTKKNLWVQIKELLLRVFADDTTGLHSAEKPVGVSIPLEIIKYLNTRIRFERSDTSDERMLTLEALEMFLFPQFESQRKDHVLLVEKLADALKLDQSTEKRKLGHSLRSWTGAIVSGDER